jgi:hypothetical protein
MRKSAQSTDGLTSPSQAVSSRALDQQARRRVGVATPAREREGEGLRIFIGLLPVIGLLWGFFFLRLFAVDIMPYFVDELRHVARGRLVWTFEDLDVSTTPRKIFLYYWLGFFNVPDVRPGWLARTAVAIFTLLGAAGTYATTRILFSRQVALASMAVLSIFPFMLFFDRLALSDPVTAALGIIVVWWSLLFIRRPNRHRTLVLGVLITLMLAAKVLALPLLIMPVLAVLLFSRQRLEVDRPLWPQVKEVWTYYYRKTFNGFLIIFGFWVFILTVYVIRRLSNPDEVSPIINSYLYTDSDQSTNFFRIAEVLQLMWGPWLVVLLLLTVPVLLWRKPRQALFLLIGVTTMWVGVFLTANKLSTRYLTVVGHLWVIIIAAGAFVTKDEIARWVKLPAFKAVAWTPVIVLAYWGVTFAGDFWITLVDEPDELALTQRDTHEYFRNQSGYALPDVLNDIADGKVLPVESRGSDVPVVEGIVRNCGFLTYHIEADTPIHVECYVYTHRHQDEWPEPDVQFAHMQDNLERYGAMYVMVEQFREARPVVKMEYLEEGVCLKLLDTYERPFDGVPIELYAAYGADYPAEERLPLNMNCVAEDRLTEDLEWFN